MGVSIGGLGPSSVDHHVAHRYRDTNSGYWLLATGYFFLLP
jgi:hypothetical protein